MFDEFFHFTFNKAADLVKKKMVECFQKGLRTSQTHISQLKIMDYNREILVFSTTIIYIMDDTAKIALERPIPGGSKKNSILE